MLYQLTTAVQHQMTPIFLTILCFKNKLSITGSPDILHLIFYILIIISSSGRLPYPESGGGEILENQPIKQHVPLLFLKRAKTIPFLRCQNTPEAECFRKVGSQSLHSVFRVWTKQVSNLCRSPHFSE